MDIKLKLYAVYRVFDKPICGVNEEIMSLKDTEIDADDYIYVAQLSYPSTKFIVKKVKIEDGMIKPDEE